MMKKLIAILLVLLPIATATAQKSTLSVTLRGAAEGVNLVVCEPHGGRLMPVDTVAPDKKGRFNIEREASADPQFFVLVLTVPNNPMVHVVLLPKEKVSIELTYLPEYNFAKISSVKGSANMEVYQGYTDIISEAMADPSKQASVGDRLAALLTTHPDMLMSAFLVTYFETSFEEYANLYKLLRDNLIGTYPTNDFVRHLDDKLRAAVVAGMEAPDIVMADRDGQTRRLSDLRGKVVLIDFWASWCRPCRAENPNVVRLYHQYKDKGFDIYSVSLDNSRDAWLKAIETDGLVWPNHVSDLRGWSSAGGKLYGVSSIPATVLVGRDGKILARNLRGAQLEQKLKEIFGQ
jgi:peroxiredoxin